MARKLLVINWQDLRHPLAGGAEVHLHEIFRRLVRRGYEVTLLATAFKNAKAVELVDGIRVIRSGRRATFNYSVPRLYRQLMRHESFDVVVDDINKIPFFTPLFVRQPLVALVHHFFGRSIFLEVPYPLAAYVYTSERFVPAVYRRIRIGAVSASTINELVSLGFERDRIHWVPNGVDLEVHSPDESERSATPLVGYFGRLKRYKCIDHLLRAVSLVCEEVPGTKVIIVGDGDDRPRLERISRQLGVHSIVRFVGAVSQEEKVHYLRRMWICVNPSPKEGWGLTVVEANACGTPVVAADSPGLRDAVVRGETGELYPYGNVGALAELLVSLLRDGSRRSRYSNAAVRWAQRFSWEQSADRMEELIEAALQ